MADPYHVTSDVRGRGNNNSHVVYRVLAEDYTERWAVMTVCGDAQQCPQRVCTADYTPVCAWDYGYQRRTFSNICHFNNFNCLTGYRWTIIGNGECNNILPSPPKDRCDIACTQEYAPVCACDGKEPPRTFSNQCYLQVFNCKTGR
uniref:Kazal-like domain-containing protein n=1 Tax=Timema tahoe TaxID=61484 RepID=A0A7R9IQN9_9NEOP|nr:unnamed protein product [Timema tahoe]